MVVIDNNNKSGLGLQGCGVGLDLFGSGLGVVTLVLILVFKAVVLVLSLCYHHGPGSSSVVNVVGALSWRVHAGLFRWNQHERVLCALMHLFCPYHDKVSLLTYLFVKFAIISQDSGVSKMAVALMTLYVYKMLDRTC